MNPVYAILAAAALACVTAAAFLFFRRQAPAQGKRMSLDEAITEWNPLKPPIKAALCIERYELPSDYHSRTLPCLYEFPVGFWQSPTTLEDRAECETDESLLQLLPYVVLVTALQTPPKIFTYLRGGAGEENRLHGKFSVGVGGHVDSEPPEHFSLRRWLLKEAQREVLEEVGLRIDPLSLHTIALINDPTNPVGRVHVGIFMVAAVNPADLGEHEHGVIENGEWLSLEELQGEPIYSRLEPWSKLAVDSLRVRGHA